MEQQIKIGSVVYIVIGSREFEHNGHKRIALRLRRPAGKRVYHAVKYETGAVSEAV